MSALKSPITLFLKDMSEKMSHVMTDVWAIAINALEYQMVEFINIPGQITAPWD